MKTNVKTVFADREAKAEEPAHAASPPPPRPEIGLGDLVRNSIGNCFRVARFYESDGGHGATAGTILVEFTDLLGAPARHRAGHLVVTTFDELTTPGLWTRVGAVAQGPSAAIYDRRRREIDDARAAPCAFCGATGLGPEQRGISRGFSTKDGESRTRWFCGLDCEDGFARSDVQVGDRRRYTYGPDRIESVAEVTDIDTATDLITLTDGSFGSWQKPAIIVACWPIVEHVLGVPAWTTLAELRPGAIFETRGGVRAVRTAYRFSDGGGYACIALASGVAPSRESLHDATAVRQIGFGDVQDVEEDHGSLLRELMKLCPMCLDALEAHPEQHVGGCPLHANPSQDDARASTCICRLANGTRVRTIEGIEGSIVGHSDSHGLCYCVRHHDGTESYYEPRELLVPHGDCARLAAAERRLRKATEALFKCLVDLPQRSVPGYEEALRAEVNAAVAGLRALGMEP